MLDNEWDSTRFNNIPEGYAGRWIALINGQIVAQGGTPNQVLQAARSNRFKEITEVKYVPTKEPLTFDPLLNEIADILPLKLKVYLVGGAVRDALLQLPTKDLDFALPRHALRSARI